MTNTCYICDKNIKKNDLYTNQSCSHTYHKNCYVQWTRKTHTTCPCKGKSNNWIPDSLRMFTIVSKKARKKNCPDELKKLFNKYLKNKKNMEEVSKKITEVKKERGKFSEIKKKIRVLTRKKYKLIRDIYKLKLKMCTSYFREQKAKIYLKKKKAQCIPCEDKTCVICLENTNESSGCFLPECGHCYHVSCISQWFCLGNINCPYCNVKPKEEKKMSDFSFASKMARRKDAPVDLKKAYDEYKKCSGLKKETQKSIKEFKNKNGIYKDMMSEFRKLQRKKWKISYKLRGIMISMCKMNTNIMLTVYS